MTCEIKYPLGSLVKILPLEEVSGRVIQIHWDWMGTTYKVRYFHRGDEKVTFAFEDELTPG